MDVLVLEGGGACEQVLVPKSENPGTEVVGLVQTDAEASHPEGADRSE